MCYSAEAWADYHAYVRKFGANIDMKEFVRLYLDRERAYTKKVRASDLPKIPKGMDLAFEDPKTPEEQQIHDLVTEWNTRKVSESEQELFKQKKRLANAERKLAVKETKTALNEQRIAGNKIEQYKRWIADAKRKDVEPKRDNRIFPDWYAPVMVVEDGKRVIKPMRYHCRPAGMDPSIDLTKDGRISGTYNARRDNLTRFWRNQFGYTHGLILADVFYEQVDRPGGGSQEIRFEPRTGESMFIACLWSHWTDPDGKLPDLLSFAAITDEPEPEVAEVGHDRTIINIKPEYVDAWLNPDSKDRESLFAIFDDKQHPYYEHRKAA